jgi:hypothetical protein
MTISFRPAVRENVPWMIGLSGGTGSGKTYSALLLASGMSGGKPFAVIDTENGRARHYADMFRFDTADLEPPFRPERYAEAIIAADEAGYPVIVVDSMTHEYVGDGGILDWQDEEFHRMGARESVKFSSWIAPKQGHKRMVTALLQRKAHIIMCFRAEEKIEIVKDERGKTQVVPKRSLVGLDGWVPITEKTLPYELTMSLLLLAQEAGVPKPIKLQEQHRPLVPLDRPLTADVGAALAEWAKGAPPKPQVITAEQQHSIVAGAQAANLTAAEAKKILQETAGVAKSADVPADKYEAVLAAINAAGETAA